MEGEKEKMMPPQTFEKPEEYTINNVMYWEPLSKALMIAKEAGDKHANPLLIKAKHFLNEGCIEQLGLSVWVCHPLKSYNKTTYFIRSTEKGFNCTCQGFNKKCKDYEEGITEIKPICSHIIAVKQFCFLKKNAS